MSVLYLVVPVALALVAVALGAFAWAARRGQFDDLTTPAMRALQDDAEPLPPSRSKRPIGDDPPTDAPPPVPGSTPTPR